MLAGGSASSVFAHGGALVNSGAAMYAHPNAAHIYAATFGGKLLQTDIWHSSYCTATEHIEHLKVGARHLSAADSS
jgi:hypothetical protein